MESAPLESAPLGSGSSLPSERRKKSPPCLPPGHCLREPPGISHRDLLLRHRACLLHPRQTDPGASRRGSCLFLKLCPFAALFGREKDRGWEERETRPGRSCLGGGTENSRERNERTGRCKEQEREETQNESRKVERTNPGREHRGQKGEQPVISRRGGSPCGNQKGFPCRLPRHGSPCRHGRKACTGGLWRPLERAGRQGSSFASRRERRPSRFFSSSLPCSPRVGRQQAFLQSQTLSPRSLPFPSMRHR